MSLNAAAIETLIGKGLSAADILDVARALEKKKDNTNAERQARHRALLAVKRNDRYSNGVTPPNDNISNPPEVSEANASSPHPWALPVGVSLQVWTDFLKNRKRKRLPNTDTAWKGFNDDLRRVAAETGIPPPKLIERCTSRGWGAIYDPRDTKHGQQSSTVGKSQAAYAMLNVDPDEPF